MNRTGLAAALVLALSACDPEVPDSAAGAGIGAFDSYATQQERAARNAQLANSSLTGSPEATGAPQASSSSATSVVSTADLAAAGIGTATPTQPPATVSEPVGAPLAATAAGAAYVAGNNVAISDEQDFNAVSARESIQSDAERLARQRSQYADVAPTAVPERPRDTGPDIVAYALSTTHPLGQPVYRRTLPNQAKAERKCAGYGSDDLAQLDFLESGGPERDRHGIDPDGDGYACRWDPGLYRRAVGG
ncbi:hypothetical protein [Aliiruegeria lutimaris]|uniref:Excalibur calcium-binding domain-containing protein n=1 Tax=Aliiruegeria lutimaris TaxID=571298 RepID=A0A1G9E256_9RHOB|nr:hypothetical protein [Aliiruegeria lutimaris]SDK70236.1 hypothetical protein SAMN04488026_105021 [Aliiruegeria lutimaris]